MPPLPPDAGINTAATALPAEQQRFDTKQILGKGTSVPDNSSAFRSARQVEVSYVPPSFTIKELRDVIPSHCFERNGFRSSLHVLEDVILLIAFGTGIWLLNGWLDAQAAPLWTKVAAWAVYSYVQGVVGMGVWVIAHEW